MKTIEPPTDPRTQAPECLVIFPHQLFENHPGLSKKRRVVLIEEPRFFFDAEEKIAFHKKKLIFHRASLRCYGNRLQRQGYAVDYVAYHPGPVLADLFRALRRAGVRRVLLADPADRGLEHRLAAAAAGHKLEILRLPTPGFLSSRGWVEDFFRGARRYSQTSFYIAQRRRLNLLIQEGKPRGGRWSFDGENRKRIPAQMPVPERPLLPEDPMISEARAYVEDTFSHHPGEAEGFFYPVSHEQARVWLADFLETRLSFFGEYQDAIRETQDFLFHSLLSPLLNVGLLTPEQVVRETMAYVQENPREVPLNALEGFLRQIVGWREFMRAVYLLAGEQERQGNFWDHRRPLPRAVYRAETGLRPVDAVLRRVHRHGYAHHIERLMVLGNFLLLCEIDPRQVYRWFMEMFIDAYDWVMVPNVFGMSQYADGGLITTKPYISSSNYLLKMSDFPRGDWCPVWDGLYWRFIHRHRDFFGRNPRLSIMVSQLERMGPDKLSTHIKNAEAYLNRLD